MAQKHGNKMYFQVLLDPHRAALVQRFAELSGLSANAAMRHMTYQFLQDHYPKEYETAYSADEAAWKQSIVNRVAGRDKARLQRLNRKPPSPPWLNDPPSDLKP